jgi:peptidoglycan/LPS O-acetylase OafA/YrhL
MTISLIQPVWLGQSDGSAIVLTPFYLLQNDQYLYFPYSLTAILSIAAITIALIEIRRFDNRPLQMKLGLLNTLLLLGAMISVFFFTNSLVKQYPIGFKNGVGMYLIFAGVLCNWIALRFIRRDERLVKESDRLR